MDEPNDAYEDLLRQAQAEFGNGAYRYSAREGGVPYADLTQFTPEPKALARVPHSLAVQHNVLPLRYAANSLYVAMSDLNDVAASDAVRLACRCTVKPVLAEPEAIRAAIARFYSQETS